MRMNIDKSGGDNQTRGIDLADSRAWNGAADGCDPLSFHRDVAVEPGVSRTVDNSAAADDEIVLRRLRTNRPEMHQGAEQRGEPTGCAPKPIESCESVSHRFNLAATHYPRSSFSR